MKVYCYPVSRESKYTPLIFHGTGDRFEVVHREDGDLDSAIASLDAGIAVIVHIHWEEFVLRGCASDDEANAAAAIFIGSMKAFRDRGGRIYWTIHNEWPHLIPFRKQFLLMRSVLARLADVILVHNSESVGVLAEQVDLDRSKVRLLPHPSYIGQYEDESTLSAELGTRHNAFVQGFGWIRLQKGFGEMIGMLPTDYLEARGLRIRISGHGIETGAVVSQQAARTDVHWDIRHVPDVDVPRLLRSAACVVLPYERVLTSGVALLAMSVGALLVAVDIPQLRELMPAVSHRFLYRRGDGKGLREAVDRIATLDPRDRQDVVMANLEVARKLHPRIVSAELADLYAGE